MALKLAERMAKLEQKVDNIDKKLDDLLSKLDNHYVSLDRFLPIEKLGYGMASFVLLAVLGAIVALVLK